MSNALIKQLGIKDSKVSKTTTAILSKYASMPSSPPPNLDPNSIWDSCKCQLIAYYMSCDRKAAQRRRDKRTRAEELSTWGDTADLPAPPAKFKSALEVRQRGEQILRELARQD